MKRLVLWVIITLPFIAKAQETKGVHFENELNWQQIQAKAKADNKYIFVDLYATWCGPCKLMDNTVYPNDSVGNFMNEHFISVKIQMDSTGSDNDHVKSWYSTVREINSRFQIAGYPCFLFFFPNGEIAYKCVGYLDPKSFMATASFALDPKRQLYYKEISDYNKGIKDYANMAGLIMTTTHLADDRKLAEIIAKDYKSNYLDTASEAVLSTRGNLLVIADYPALVTSSQDNYFKLFYQHPEIADKIMEHPGFSASFVKFIIAKEEINDKLFRDGKAIVKNPDWKKIGINIQHKYGDVFSASDLFQNEMSFYMETKNFKRFAFNVDSMIKVFPPKKGGKEFGAQTLIGGFGIMDDDWALNSAAWNIFQACNDKSVLEKALKWSDLSIQINTVAPLYEYLDTKANLLYELGMPQKAIALEKVAITKATAVRQEDQFLPTLKKMQSGLPTWTKNPN